MMIFYIKSLLFASVISIVGFSCTNSPKVVSARTKNAPAQDTSRQSSGIFSESPIQTYMPGASPSFSDDLHQVVVNEVLPTTKYVYLNVSEGEEQFWIATAKMEVQKGEKYYFKGGLLKTNFESREYERIFEKVYLVSNLVAENHASGTSPGLNDIANSTNTVSGKQSNEKQEIEIREGSIRIAELVKNPKKYEGETVQITGRCVKVNPNIMNRNWIHLQDGSKDDFDLVVTSSEYIPEGHVATLQAVVGLERDFGAGYKYNLILENGVIIR